MSQPRADMAEVVLAQLGLNTADMGGTLRLYNELFGFANAGGNALWGDLIRIQGLASDSHCMMWWMVGAAPYFQLELFNHGRPRQRPKPADWRPSDHGWVRFGVAVKDFDRARSGLERWAITVLGTGQRNGERRLAFKDPYLGVIVEVMETRSRPCPGIVYATSSVADLGAARHFYADVVGAEIADLATLHVPEDEAMWGLDGAQCEGFLVRLGDALLEIIRYSKPEGRPRPADHLVSDQGIMNVGLGSRNMAAIRSLLDRIRADGHETTMVFDGPTIGTYINEPGYEIELFSTPPEFDAALGFAPAGSFLAEFGK